PKTLHVDVRVLAATNKDLESEIRAGRFREDLYFRINTLIIEVPPLRDSRPDIPLLIEHFVERFSVENNRRPISFYPEGMLELSPRAWRGNVRELKSAVERLRILAEGETIALADLAALRGASLAPAGSSFSRYRTLQEFKDATERQFIEEKLKEYDWNISATA